MARPKVKLTPSSIASMCCELNGKGIPKNTYYWCVKTPNFGVLVSPKNYKSFIFEGWLNGENLRMTLGNVDSWSIPHAQAEGRRLKVLTDRGIDPRVEKAEIAEKIKAQRIKGVAGLIVWDEYVNIRKSNWGDRHLADHIDMAREGGEVVTRGLKTNQPKLKEAGILRPLLNLPLGGITREKVEGWLKGEVIKRPARTRLALSALKAFITWCGDHSSYQKLVHIDACDRLTRELPSKKARDDCLQKEQLSTWFAAILKINNPVISAYLQILLLTGARRNELASLKWEDIDLVWNTATIKDKVEGSRQIPLTPYVAQLLSKSGRVNEYVFPSPTAKSGRITEPRIAHNLALKDTNLPSISIHGLRRSFGTLAEWVECPAGISAQIMGHKPSAIAEKHYRKRPIDLLRQWHTKIEIFILKEAGILDGEVASS
jgi:integrase